MSPDGSERRVRSQVSTAAAIGASIVVLVLAWWWPGLTGRGDLSEVTVVGSGEIATARDVVSQRLREAGLSVRWVDSVSSWCELVSVAENAKVVVVQTDDLRSCTLEGTRIEESNLPTIVAQRLVIVSLNRPSSTAMTELEDKGARPVPIGRLIGAIDEPLPCVWWDDCPQSGNIVTRVEEGLTEAGKERLARLIVTLVS